MRWSIAALTLLHLCPHTSFSLVNAQPGGPPPHSKAGKAYHRQPNAAGSQEGGPQRQVKDTAAEFLHLRPLEDRKIATHFEFEYLSRNAVPRDPRTLGQEDEGMLQLVP